MPIKPFCPLRFAKDEDGAVAVIVALMLTVLFGFVALGVDVASLYRDRAQLQAAGDLAAMSGVANTAQASPRAGAALARNGHSADALRTLQLGRFLRNPELPRTERFKPLPAGAPGINAVALTVEDDAPLHFARVFADKDRITLDRTSTAIRTGAASFSLTSNLLRLEGATLGNLLSDVFGAEVSLSAQEAGVLSDVSVNAGDFLVALEDVTGLNRRNPAAILDQSTDAQAILEAASRVAPGGAGAILSGLATAAGGMGGVPVTAVLGGIDTDLGLTAVEFASDLEISALDILRALAASDQAGGEVTAQAVAGVPGVLSVAARLAMGEPPAHSSLVGIGEQGVQLNRAAARLKADVGFALDTLPLLGQGISLTRLHLPIYAEVAGSTATLENLSCALPEPTSVAARFSTAPTELHPSNGTSVAALYLGNIAQDVFERGPIDPANIGFADIAEIELRIDLPLLPDIVLPGITLQARSNLPIGTSARKSLTFTRAEIERGETTKHFGSEQLLGSAVSGLLSPDRLEVRVKPQQQGLISGLFAPLLETALAALPEALLLGLVSPLDGVLDGLLASAGIRLGEGALTLEEHHCEMVRLVR